jgi:hypothetical protein
MILESGMKNSHRPAVQCPELVPHQPLLLPDDLEQMLGWKQLGVLAQRAAGQRTGAPARIEIGGMHGHWSHAFASRPPNVKPR